MGFLENLILKVLIFTKFINLTLSIISNLSDFSENAQSLIRSISGKFCAKTLMNSMTSLIKMLKIKTCRQLY